MSLVYVEKASYDRHIIQKKLNRLMDDVSLPGISHGKHVLIKPNFLMPAEPETAVLTHPSVLEAVLVYIIEKGGIPTVSDSPGTGGFSKILMEGGYSEIIKKYNVNCCEFKTSVPVDIGGSFGTINLAEELFEYDCLINLPKLKTHVMMLLTLGVKNLFGCIIGRQKAEWHMRAGIETHYFAELLVRIAAKIKPDITLVDGILSLEGQGPGKNGNPRKTGLLLGGKNIFSVDMAVCMILGIHPDSFPTHKSAIQTGLYNGSLNIIGSFESPGNFILPKQDSPVFGPEILKGFLRKHLIRKPVIIKDRCSLCEKCIKHCPANSIRMDGKNLIFNYNQCIRCYCCVELCPQAALKAAETVPGVMLRKFLGFKS